MVENIFQDSDFQIAHDMTLVAEKLSLCKENQASGLLDPSIMAVAFIRIASKLNVQIIESVCMHFSSLIIYVNIYSDSSCQHSFILSVSSFIGEWACCC